MKLICEKLMSVIEKTHKNNPIKCPTSHNVVENIRRDTYNELKVEIDNSMISIDKHLIDSSKNISPSYEIKYESCSPLLNFKYEFVNKDETWNKSKVMKNFKNHQSEKLVEIEKYLEKMDIGSMIEKYLKSIM